MSSLNRRLRRLTKLPRFWAKRFMVGILRALMISNRPDRLGRAGFVLPTTVLLVLMVVLTTSALTYRAFSRSDMAISQREQKVIMNAATPAIDRAKAKIEFLFQSDPRFPAGVPASDILSDLMATKRGTNNFVGYTGRVPILGGGPTADPHSPYTLPDETRLDINGDGNLDNAWSFRSDIDGNGTIDDSELIAYSILVDDEGPGTTTGTNAVKISDPVSPAKANALVTRTGPLATTEANPNCAGSVAEGGWQVVTQGNNSTLQKNFQINAFVANANNANRTFETLEFQQSRIASRASRWGAWFRYDLDVFPGAEFNWNGAMHTDGSFFANQNNFRSHMISSHNSCLYSQEASTITMAEVDLDGDGVATPGKVVTIDGVQRREFQGQAVRGAIVNDNYTSNGRPFIHHWDGPGRKAVTNRDLTEEAAGDQAHSVSGGKPSDVSMNPLALFTRDVTEHNNASTWSRRAGWANSWFARPAVRRIENDEVSRPFVDDFFRADNRWGPKPRYDARDTTLDVTRRAGTTIGDPITDPAVTAKLTNLDDGLDGYWERRAIKTGMRLIVGERLQLGNVNEWGKNPITGIINPEDEAMYPPTGRPTGGNQDNRYGRNHQYLQRRSLRDNLAAVQGMVVYHYQKDSGEFPAACVAATSHPGTPQSILNSRTFNNYPTATTLLRADFFSGTGTNGWEFQFPAAFNTPVGFADEIADGRPLGVALRNLARFAGDPAGGAPSFKPVQDVAGVAGSEVHPAPFLSMWGDFSPLRRILAAYDADTVNTARNKYRDLSPADKATLHSAACTLSMLAYNITSDYAEYEELIKNYTPPDSLNNTLNQAGTLVNRITNYMAAGQFSGNTGQARNIQDALIALGRNQPWVDPRPNTAIVDVKTGNTICAAATDTAGFEPLCDTAQFFSEFTFEDWVALLSFPGLVPSINLPNDINDLISVSDQVNRLNVLLRDRDLGFRLGITRREINVTPAATPVQWVTASGLTEAVNPQGSTNYVFRTACDPNIFRNVTANGGGGNPRVVMGGLVACSQRNNAQMPRRYPSLYYLFPLVAHDHDGTGDHQQPDGNTPPPPATPQVAEPYITNPYVRSVNPLDSNLFRVVGTDPVKGLSAIAAVPRSATASDWTIPAAADTTGAPTTANISDRASAFKILGPGGAVIRVPFLDKGLFDGREQLNTRVLDIDIEALTRRRLRDVATNDFWLTTNKDNQAEGVVYAFREDAVREDEIARPRANNTITANDCSGITNVANNRFALETNVNCRSRFNGSALRQDPPLSADGISLKPVDFIPDPQRRAHGFRLRTYSGAPADFSGANYARNSGMTFVTDNAVYIMGNFNPHTSDGTVNNILEEFTQTLYNKTLANAFGDRFYNDRTTLDLTRFAVPAVDHWRPVEILSDSLTVLSGTYRDGSVLDTFIRATPTTAQGSGTSSYMNQNRPRFTGADLVATDWVLERPGVLGSPVWVDRNGTYYRATGTYANQAFYETYRGDDDWTRFDRFSTNSGQSNDARRPNLQRAETTYVNALFVSGIVPKRIQQSYGGLHNYPRFQEDWQNIDLHIAGAFIQLNFSTAATGPFDQDSWEEGDNPSGNEFIGYYWAPNRRWGYDVGLLYLPPAPAARRFVSIGAARSEYYRELAADDDYILNLRCARRADGTRLMPNFCPRP
jgi:hypothetical protein